MKATPTSLEFFTKKPAARLNFMPITLQELNTYDPYNAYVNLFLNDHFRYNRLHDKLKGLPNNFSDFLFDLKTAEFIKGRIAVPFNLNQERAQELAIIVLELITADWYLGDIVNQIRERGGVEEQKAKTIAGLIVTQLFAPILEELKKMHIEKFAKNLPKPNQDMNNRVVNLKNT